MVRHFQGGSHAVRPAQLKAISVQFDSEFFAGVEDDAGFSPGIDVDGTVRALTVAMLAEAMKSARAALALP
jgi:hypothetical protein